MKTLRKFIYEQLEEYQGAHQAPTSSNSAPLWNVSHEIYPDDFYSANGLRYYGTGSKYDGEAYSTILSAHGRRDKRIRIYRAVPKGVKGINVGDWVTISRGYAKDHGESALGGSYSVISQAVNARDLFTDGNSFLEWGYDPQPRIPYKQRDGWEKWPGKK